MKTLHALLALAAITLLLATAPGLRAGPPPDYQNRMHAAVTPAAKTPAATQVACGSCRSAGCACGSAHKPKAGT